LASWLEQVRRKRLGLLPSPTFCYKKLGIFSFGESMTTRRRLLLFGLPAALVLLGVGAVVLWPRPSAITPENAKKIQKGMTLAEVEELLGGPARNESGMPDNFINDAFVIADAEEIKMGRLRPGPRPFKDKRWAVPGYLIVVDFDDSGLVVRHQNFTVDVHRSFLDRLRRWLRF
jgi:hypothetical protein